jgi:hypothetical protein
MPCSAGRVLHHVSWNPSCACFAHGWCLSPVANHPAVAQLVFSVLCPTTLQVVEKTTRNALDVLDWIGLKHVGKTPLGSVRCRHAAFCSTSPETQAPGRVCALPCRCCQQAKQS